MKQMSNRVRTRISGFTLVELIVVMAILSAVMGISVTLIFMMFDFQQRYAEQSAQINSTNRFFEQFREDAHQQYAANLSPDDESLLHWDGGPDKIVYSLVPGEFPEKNDVVRRVFCDGQLVATETYHLPDYANLRFVSGEGLNIGQIAMSLWIQPPYAVVIKPEELDPFSRTLTGPQAKDFDPNVDGKWRTAIVCVSTAQNVKTEEFDAAAQLTSESEGSL